MGIKVVTEAHSGGAKLVGDAEIELRSTVRTMRASSGDDHEVGANAHRGELLTCMRNVCAHDGACIFKRQTMQVEMMLFAIFAIRKGSRHAFDNTCTFEACFCAKVMRSP